ncbi:MAG: hypothetical protein DI535_19115 [Citrobacter freundii]|nr:MAG: hypothetical protein DI535_19115 [Citrobacter freundii]
MICKNCGASAEGKYCNQCGQKLGLGRMSMHELAHDAWHGVTHTDKGILKLLKDLTIRPRAFYQEYFSGKRKTYFNPVMFFLLMAGLVVLLYPFVFDYEDKITHENNEFGRILFHLAKYRVLALLPFQIGLTWLFYHKRFNLAEIIVFWLFVMGWLQALHVLIIPLYFPLIHHKSVIDNLYTIISFVLMVWQGLMFTQKINLKNILSWLIIVNIVYVIEYFFQVVLIFDWNFLQTNTEGWKSIWDVIKARYHW